MKTYEVLCHIKHNGKVISPGIYKKLNLKKSEIEQLQKRNVLRTLNIPEVEKKED